MGSQMGTFSNIRRVQLKGRDTIAIDYQGNPHAKSHTMLDGIFRNLAGTVWVDEQDHALVRIEGHVFEDYKVGGGLLADVHKGATIEAEWIKVNDEVWLPAWFRWARVGAHRASSPTTARIDRRARVGLPQVPHKLYDSSRRGRGPRRHECSEPTPTPALTLLLAH